MILIYSKKSEKNRYTYDDFAVTFKIYWLHYDMIYFSLYFLLEKVQKLSLQFFTRRNILICWYCIISRLYHPNFDNFYSVMRECHYLYVARTRDINTQPYKTRYWSTWLFSLTSWNYTLTSYIKIWEVNISVSQVVTGRSGNCLKVPVQYCWYIVTP